MVITEIENPSPADDLIKTYKDFTTYRKFLPHYQFNKKVFESLVNIASTLWNTNESISRVSLIEYIKRYGNKNPDKKTLPPKTSSQLFEIFKSVLTKRSKGLKENSLNEMKSQVNLILKDIKLKEDELQWLIDNLDKSEHFLNRVLRHPAKSKVVSQWAKENFFNNFFRERRAELIGRMLDFNPQFEVTNELIIEDFEYSLKHDYQCLKSYREEEDAVKFLERELRGILPSKKVFSPFLEKNINAPFISSHTPLKLSNRFYPFPVKEERGDVKIPDFEKMREHFYENVDLTWRISMGWGIAYSHLDNKEKNRLLQKFYSENVYLYYFKIGKQFKIMEFLNWLFEKYR